MNAPPDMTRAPFPAQEGARHDQHPPRDTDPLSASTIAAAALGLPSDVLAALVELLPDPAAEAELRQQLCREAARDAYHRGYQAGYERGARVLEAEWPAVIKPLSGPTLAELELLRWGPGGREHFGDPRPGDRPPTTRLEAAS